MTDGLQDGGWRRALPVKLLLLLLLSTAFGAGRAHYRFMWIDEFFELQTDSVKSLAAVVHVQRTTPIALDPMVYHALVHGAMKVVGVGAFGVRLPSLLGYLLMQVCLFVGVRRWFPERSLGERAGMVAVACTMVASYSFFQIDGRPYGVLLGLDALAYVLWQSATRTGREAGGRGVVLVALSASIALAINTHYFGMLILLPLCAAEIWRSFAARRVDWPVVLSLGAGAVWVVLLLPFMPAAREYQAHYYALEQMSAWYIVQAYRPMLMGYKLYPQATQVKIDVFLLAAVSCAAWGFYKALRSRRVVAPLPEVVFVLVLSALPVFGYGIGALITHSVEARHVLPAVLGLTIVFAVGATGILQRPGWGVAAECVVLAVAIVLGAHRLSLTRRESVDATVRYAQALSPEVRSAMEASPSGILYIGNPELLDMLSYYLRDPRTQSHMVLVESRKDELRLSGHDTGSLTMRNMRSFTGFTILSYEQLKRQPGPVVMTTYQDSTWEWTGMALRRDAASVRELGTMLDGVHVVEVRFKVP